MYICWFDGLWNVMVYFRFEFVLGVEDFVVKFFWDFCFGYFFCLCLDVIVSYLKGLFVLMLLFLWIELEECDRFVKRRKECFFNGEEFVY